MSFFPQIMFFLVLVAVVLGPVAGLRKEEPPSQVCMPVLNIAEPSTQDNDTKRGLDLTMGSCAADACRLVKEIEESVKEEASENAKLVDEKMKKKLGEMSQEIKNEEKHVKRQLKDPPMMLIKEEPSEDSRGNERRDEDESIREIDENEKNASECLNELRFDTEETNIDNKIGRSGQLKEQEETGPLVNEVEEEKREQNEAINGNEEERIDVGNERDAALAVEEEEEKEEEEEERQGQEENVGMLGKEETVDEEEIKCDENAVNDSKSLPLEQELEPKSLHLEQEGEPKSLPLEEQEDQQNEENSSAEETCDKNEVSKPALTEEDGGQEEVVQPKYYRLGLYRWV